MNAVVGSWDKGIHGGKEDWRDDLCDPLDMGGRWSATLLG